VRLYLDTSALVKIYVDEAGSAGCRQAVGEADLIATSALAYVEARAAFSRRRREGGLPPKSYRRVIADLDDDWPSYAVVDVTEGVIREGARLAERHRLRAYDAVHLASATALREVGGVEPVMFASWDAVLGRAARREGLSLLQASS
jgi:predicted nucleic acid-binding protein